MIQSQALEEGPLTLCSAVSKGIEIQVSSFISAGSSPEAVRCGVIYPGIDGLVQM